MADQTIKLLIVEDDTFIRELYEELFADEGYAVTVAEDGQQAHDLLEKQAFDLTLLDIMLPKIDGMSLFKDSDEKIRQNLGKVVLLTNLGQDAVIKEGFASGAVGYLIKSALTPDEVLKEVQVFLEQE